MPIPVLVLFGPTASGKTELAFKLFSYFNSVNFLDSQKPSHLSGCAELISADSIQVYKYLSIGSATPSSEILKELPHHLVSIKNPDTEFSAADFVYEADNLCREIYQRKKLPVLIGGTGFFLKNFLYGLPITPKASPEVRLFFQKRAEKEGVEVLLDELKTIDPISFQRLHVNDQYRIIRAHEVFALSGKPLSSFKLPSNFRNQYIFFIVNIYLQRNILYNNIEKRIDEMITAGLYDEVKNLIEMGYSLKTPALNAIGYKEFFDKNGKIKGKDKIQEIAAIIKRNTKHYAKRQEIFFKKIPNVHKYNIEIQNEKIKLYNDITTFFNKHF